MARKRRVAAYVALGVVVALALLAIALFVLTQTEPGIRQVGRYTVDYLDDRIRGEVRVGSISSPRGLLAGINLRDVEVTDPDGDAFIAADSVFLSYDWRTFVSGRIVFDGIALYEPVILLQRMPGDTAWNFERAFAGTTPTPPEPQPTSDRLVMLGGIAIYDGRLIVRMPWEPDDDEPTEPEDTARLILERVPGGFVRVMRFEDLDANLPRIVWESPYEEGQLFEIASLATRGYIWETPVLLRDLRGTVTLRDSLLSFDAARIVLPDSRASAIGQVVISGTDYMDLLIRADAVALEDIQWVLPTLPRQGIAEGTLRIRTLGPNERTLWIFEDMRFRAPDTRLEGTLGFVTGDSLYFTRVDLHAEPLDLELLQRLIPGDLPLEGLRVGSVDIRGPAGE